MKDNASAFNSDEYDRRIRQTLPYYGEFYEQAADAAEACLSGPLTWLDAGCGTGKMGEVALRRLDIARFVFCDSSAEMLEIARERFSGPRTAFLQADIRELDFTGRFDVVTAIQVNHYFHEEDRILAIRSCARALKPGGVFITFENFAPFTAQGKQLALDRWKAFQLRQGKSPEECAAYLARYGKDYFPITVSDHLETMNRCGFSAVEVLWLSGMQVGLLGIR